MAFGIVSMKSCIFIEEYMHKGSGRRNLRDCNVHIRSDMTWPEYLLPTTMTLMTSPKLKACGGTVVRSRPIVVLFKLEDAVSWPENGA